MLGQTAGDAALRGIGINATKVGGGDKEKAYVVRQNAMLRIALCIILGALFILGILAVTVLDVKVQRKSATLAKMGKRQQEHWEHQDIIRKDLKLQEMLREEQNDAEMVKDARATMGSLLKSYEKDLLGALKGTPQEQTVMGHHSKFATYLKKLIGQVYHASDKELKTAQAAMGEVASDIAREAREDSAEEAEYEKELEDMGEDVHAYKIVDENGNTEMPETHMPDGDHEAEHHSHFEEQSAEEIQGQLERFWKKADAAAETYKKLSDADLEEINKFYTENVMKTLEAEDPESIDKNKLEADVNAKLTSKGLPKWDDSMKTKYPEVMDYIQEVIDHMHAKAAKPKLDKLREDIKADTKTVMEGVAELEKLGIDGNVPLHWMWLEEQPVGFEEDEQYQQHAGAPGAPLDEHHA
jgi:hypothetical protein